MYCKDYLEELKKSYHIVRKLSEKNGALTLLLRHRTLNRYLVFRQYNAPIEVYDYLKTITFENLPTVYDTYRFDDGQIVLEEYIDGLTVAEVMENGLYTYDDSCAVVYDVCKALVLLHSQGFIHRDIKPENVIVAKNGSVKLIDFNASRRVVPAAGSDTVQIGTLGYASPEQLGIAQSDNRTDIYALGVLLNVMLTGEHPSKRLAGGRAGKVVLKCTQIAPSSRFQSVNELMSAL